METAGQMVLNLIFLLGCLLGIPILIAKFLDEVWLRDEQKRQLRAKFESWWLTVLVATPIDTEHQPGIIA